MDILYRVRSSLNLLFLFLAKVERPMALNLANDDDGGSQMEVAQKDSAESYPGTEST